MTWRAISASSRARPYAWIRPAQPRRSRACWPASGGKPQRGADPIALMKAMQEPRRNRRQPRRPQARRRGAGALSRLARPEAPSRQAHRNRRGRGAGELPPRHRRAQGYLVPDHRRRGAERRHRALSRHPRPTGRIGKNELFLIDSGAQYEDGTTDITRTIVVGEPTRRDARPFHPRAQRPYRHRHRDLSRKTPAARSSTRWRARRCGRPGSISTTAPATASAAICRCTKARRASPSSAPSRCGAA